MAGVRDEALASMPGFPLGVNNRAAETALPPGALRQSVNSDLDNDGKPSRRDGFTLIEAGRVHSLFASEGFEHMLGVRAGDLVAYDANLDRTTVRAGVGEAQASAAHVVDRVYWSNGRELRCIDEDLTDHPGWIAAPGQPRVAAYDHGGLAAGRYQVAVTWMDALGRESGSSLATLVTVAEGGGIELTGIPANADAVTIRIYVSNTNGPELYWAKDIPAAATDALVGVGQRGKLLATQFLEPMPAGHIVRYWGNRLLVATDAGLHYSQSLLPGLTHPDNVVYYRSINLLQPVGDGEAAGSGVYVDDGKRVYFLAGGNPEKWGQVTRHHKGAVRGTGMTINASLFGSEYTGDAAFWLSSAGTFCLGLPGGQVKDLTGKALALPGFQRGATVFREKNGIRQIISSLYGASSNGLAITDSAVATIRRHGVSLD